VAIDFSDKILVVHPTTFDLGRAILFLALIAIAIGAVTCFTGAFLMPTSAWFAMAVPTLAVGAILIGVSLRRS
jgi:hypothetical protein